MDPLGVTEEMRTCAKKGGRSKNSGRSRSSNWLVGSGLILVLGIWQCTMRHAGAANQLGRTKATMRVMKALLVDEMTGASEEMHDNVKYLLLKPVDEGQLADLTRYSASLSQRQKPADIRKSRKKYEVVKGVVGKEEESTEVEEEESSSRQFHHKWDLAIKLKYAIKGYVEWLKQKQLSRDNNNTGEASLARLYFFEWGAAEELAKWLLLVGIMDKRSTPFDGAEDDEPMKSSSSKKSRYFFRAKLNNMWSKGAPFQKQQQQKKKKMMMMGRKRKEPEELPSAKFSEKAAGEIQKSKWVAKTETRRSSEQESGEEEEEEEVCSSALNNILLLQALHSFQAVRVDTSKCIVAYAIIDPTKEMNPEFVQDHIFGDVHAEPMRRKGIHEDKDGPPPPQPHPSAVSHWKVGDVEEWEMEGWWRGDDERERRVFAGSIEKLLKGGWF